MIELSENSFRLLGLIDNGKLTRYALIEAAAAHNISHDTASSELIRLLNSAIVKFNYDGILEHLRGRDNFEQSFKGLGKALRAKIDELNSLMFAVAAHGIKVDISIPSGENSAVFKIEG